jgi:hypothetical protein
MTFHVGQPFRPSASRENEIEKMLRDYRAGRLEYKTKEKEPMPMGHMLAKNETGADLEFGSPAMYRERSYKSTSNYTEWDVRRDVLVLSPADTLKTNVGQNAKFGGMVVALEPIASNELGRVAVSGLALVNGVADQPASKGNWQYLAPNVNNQIRFSYWGFARVLARQAPQLIDTDGTMSLVDLSSKHFQAAYQLKQNFIGNTALATLGEGGHTWDTHVVDLYNIAATVQRAGNKGFCEWRGEQWIATIPFC